MKVRTQVSKQQFFVDTRAQEEQDPPLPARVRSVLETTELVAGARELKYAVLLGPEGPAGEDPGGTLTVLGRTGAASKKVARETQSCSLPVPTLRPCRHHRHPSSRAVVVPRFPPTTILRPLALR